MANGHEFCRSLLSEVRADAKRDGVKIPAKLTAIASTGALYFVQGVNDRGEYLRACCSADAKAKRISRLYERHAPAGAPGVA